MTPEVWQRVKSLVGDALERPEHERAGFISSAGEATTVVREAQSILAQSAERLEVCAENVNQAVKQESSLIGERIGAYRILRAIGRGGMGAVYLAERADGAFDKLVAIKILKRGTDTDEVLRRFRSERQILARLNHPNIAGLLDGGETDDGLPYFVMEYVNGIPITTYAREHKLTVADRLNLFRVVCSAVGYAHQNLVIHRDLKPNNVLVSDTGDVKLLDFGIAKLVDEAEFNVTLTLHRAMTPEYASPEQVKGQPVTTVSDVYSLGVLLYELLAGERPYKLKTRSQIDITKAICQQEPDRPSTVVGRTKKPEIALRNLLRGDLDNIVLKALRKEPERRYVSVDQFSADIRRHLEGLPVRARKITAAYRLSKFVQRYKIGVIAAGLVVLMLIAASATTAWEAHVARLEKIHAERRFKEVRAIADSLMFEFYNAIRDLPGALAARQLVIGRALEYLDGLAQETGNDLALKSELAAAYSKIGSITFDVEQSINSHRKATTMDEEIVHLAPTNPGYQEQLADSYSQLSDALKIAGHSEESINYGRKALAILQRLAAANGSTEPRKIALANSYLELGIALRDPGEIAEALQSDLQARQILEPIAASKDFDREVLHRLICIYAQLVDAYADDANNAVALDYAEKEMAGAQKLLDSDPVSARYRRDMWSAHFHIAKEQAALGDFKNALSSYLKASEIISNLSLADPADKGHRRWSAVTQLGLGNVLCKMNKTGEAIQNYRKAIAISENLLVSDTERFESQEDLVEMDQALANCLLKTGDSRPALESLNKALSYAEENARHDSHNLRIRAQLAKVYADMGTYEQMTVANENRKIRIEVARNWYQRSDEIWQALRSSGKLMKIDAEFADKVAGEIAACDAALR